MVSGDTEIQTTETEAFEEERSHFRALLLANPNYFGNLKQSAFEPIMEIVGNTFYEEIGCVGFQPQFDRLEAVIYVNQPFGYGGDICSAGTPEYVRFYLSCDGASTWTDLGLTSFRAYDIPEGTEERRRLEYAASLDISPAKRFCFVDNLCIVRAILSWNLPPPPNDPGFVPVWGNVHDTNIQIGPRRRFPLADLFKTAQLELPPQAAEILDVTQELSATAPKAVPLADLQERYGDRVEPHRLALKELQEVLEQAARFEAMQAPGAASLAETLGIELPDVGLLFPDEGNTAYEELECIGLDPNVEHLVGVIRVKLPYGFSGGLCTAGSLEYVTFWADIDGDGSFETCLGTTSVNVYDIDPLPEGGLEYAVFLPVDFNELRQRCEKGARVLRVRAILSWNVPPPCANPNYIPVWGNRLETLVHIKPGNVVSGHPPIIQTVGSMDVNDVSPVTGLANGAAALAGFIATDSPFGGEVILTGHIGNTPDISSGATRLKYRVEVSGDGGLSWQRVTNSFNLGIDQLLNGVWSSLPPITQTVDGDDFYDYQEDLVNGPGNAQLFPVGNVLGRWQTAGLSGVWLIRIVAKDPAGPGPVWTSNVVAVRIDSEAPTVGITITSGGGPCADFTIGDVIDGTYSVSDQHFGGLTLSVSPAQGGSFIDPPPAPPGPTMPLSRQYPFVPTTGEAGTWQLDTAGMPRCGYVVNLHAADRTIVNSGAVGRHAHTVVGLCIREPGEA
jgi:hypothetical protein